MIDRLVRFVNTVSFHRGLALGALVGAAIAGSTVWSRVREARTAAAAAQSTADWPNEPSANEISRVQRVRGR